MKLSKTQGILVGAVPAVGALYLIFHAHINTMISRGDYSPQCTNPGTGTQTCIVTTSGPTTEKPAANTELNGTWEGKSVHSPFKNQGEFTDRFFTVNLVFSGPSITGKASDGRPGMSVKSGVSGSIDGDTVRLTKRYTDYSQDVIHAVTYLATLDRKSQQMQGTWNSDTGEAGTFSLRLSPVPYHMD